MTSSKPSLELSWVRVGGVCGMAGTLSYLAAAFLPLPDTLTYAAAFAFGPLLSVSALGLYHCLALHRDSPLLQIATLFAIAGGITVLIMLTVQQSIFGVMQAAVDKAGEQPAKEVYEKIAEGLNTIHWGMDVAWDVLISVAAILFGIGMLRHPQFGKIIGALGILLGSLLLVFNLYYFPTPPASVDSIDWGPFVALWFTAVFILLLRAGGWVREKTP